MPASSTLHLGLFFDGTGNHLANAHNDDATHIAKLYALYPNTPDQQRLSLYIEGIGTREGEADSLFAMATGKGRLGWEAGVEKACAGICQGLERWLLAHPGRRIEQVEIDLFGFSRGAACARHLANELYAGPKGAVASALARSPAIVDNGVPQIRIGFMGLFDTVASVLGAAPQLQLQAGMARTIKHLVARDEHRYNFPLTASGPWDLPMPGAHADIGGGYPPVMEERLLLTRPEGSHVAPGRAVETASSYQRCVQWLRDRPAGLKDPGFACRIVAWTKDQYANGRGDRVESVQVHAAVEGRREVRNDLSGVYLQIMHRLAVADGVPMRALGEPPYGPELTGIANKLQAYAHGHVAGASPDDAGLTDEEQALLYRHYIHHSSHWTVDGPGQTSDLEARFVHRPEPSARRRTLLA